MNKRWHKDGLTRKRQEEQLRIQQPFRALEEDFSNLFTRALHAAGFIRYFNSTGASDGSFASLYHYQPLVILNEIKQFDAQAPEQLFLQLGTAPAEDKTVGRNRLKEDLHQQLKEWHTRLNHSLLKPAHSLLQRDINQYNRVVASLPMADGRSTQQDFFLLLRYVRNLQDKYDTYQEELMQSGSVDPSLAVLIAGIRNYQYLAHQFNNRWEKYPDYYLQNILGAEPEKAAAPSAWFLLKKNDTPPRLNVPQGTGFITIIPPHNRPACYRTLQSVCLNNMQLHSVTTLQAERDKEKYPAGALQFVTAMLQKEISARIEVLPEGADNKTSEPLFGTRFAGTGLMLESPMLLLREGVRNVEVLFGMDEASASYFNSLANRLQQIALEKDDPNRNHPDVILYKMLSDAFYIEISTAQGWSRICNFGFAYHRMERRFCLRFCLDETFGATVPCHEPHGCTTHYPALRLLMDRDAWLYPYSWATEIRLEKLTLKTTVSGITSLEVHNELGQIDPTNPFPPFGSQPERGAWLAAGSYEMALKPVQQISFKLGWQQLPTTECGFYDRYANYPEAIDNTSFKVRLEQLADKKWRDIPGSLSPLFATTDSTAAPTPRGCLAESSTIACLIKQPAPAISIEEQRFRYGSVRSGFFRILLDRPNIGFGHNAYRRVFADTMMKNSFSRRKVSPPEPPLTPILDSIEAGYTACNEHCFIAGKQTADTRLYHINPLNGGKLSPADTTRPVPFCIAPHDEGNILFNIRNAQGNDFIRLFIEMAPQRREVEEAYLPEVKWHYYNGQQWICLPPESIHTDTTGCLINSGLIEIALPQTIGEEQIDNNGNFQLAAGIRRHTAYCPPIRSFYLNPVEARMVADEETATVFGEELDAFCGKAAFEKTYRGLTDVYQIMPCHGRKAAETLPDTRIRITRQINHRQRAVTPADYEQMILAKFEEVEKVLCLPATDSKQQQRKAIVTLVVMQKENNKQVLPLCEHRLLEEIETYISQYTSPFVVVDAIAPVYEEVTVCCRIETEGGTSVGETIRQAELRINACIAPWMKSEQTPLFAHSFSSTDLSNTMREDSAILRLDNLSALHVIGYQKAEERKYHLSSHSEQDKPNFMIAPSAPWCILVPAEKHRLYVNSPNSSLPKPGIGDLGIGGTFIINK